MLQNGIIYGYYFEHLEAGKIYRLDLIHQAYCKLPDNDIFDGSPGVAVDNIYIRCDGPDPIRYSLNSPNENEMKGGVITMGIERKIETELNLIKSINFQIYSGSASAVSIEVGV